MREIEHNRTARRVGRADSRSRLAAALGGNPRSTTPDHAAGESQRNASRPSPPQPRHAYPTQSHDHTSRTTRQAPADAAFQRTKEPRCPELRFHLKLQGRDHEVMLSEHVPAEMFANEPYADQLWPRLRWRLERLCTATAEEGSTGRQGVAPSSARNRTCVVANDAEWRRYP
jgi:hypothetical protein